jgi:hypothetical protein
MKKLQEREEAAGLFTTTPYWKDSCEHGPENYVCSFTTLDHIGKKVEHFDLYLFAESFYGTEVCIRYGNEGHEYISPGGLLQFIRTAGQHTFSSAYRKAAEILIDRGCAFWEVRVKK